MRKSIVVMQTTFQPVVTKPGNPVRYNCDQPPAQTPCRHEGAIVSECSHGPEWHTRQCLHPNADWDNCRRNGTPGENEQRCLGCPLYEPPAPPAQPAPMSRDWPIARDPFRRFDQHNLAPGRPGLRFNSSIIEHGDGYALAFRNGWKGSDIFIATFDRDFQPTGHCVPLKLGHFEANYGREDPRLFMHAGKIHVAFIGVAGRRRIVHTSQLFARLGPNFEVEDVFYPHYPARNAWEKNWQFFEHAGLLYAVYAIAPHKVLRIASNDATLVYETPTPAPWAGGEMRGGASPVKVGDEFWCFFHSRVGRHGQTVYNMGLYTFDAEPPFEVRRVIPEPILDSDMSTKPEGQYAHVVWPGGAVLRDGVWTIACGIHDRWTEFYQFDHAELERRLYAVRPPRFQFRPESNDDDIFKSINTHDEYRLGGLQFQPDDVVLDIGAHVGSFSFAAWVRGSRRIVAVEANPGNFAMLQANARKLPGVETVHVAVWSETGRSVYSHVQANGTVNLGGRWVSEEKFGDEVGTVSLDDLLRKWDRIAFLKMDIESSEFPAVLPATELHRVSRIAMEFHNEPAPLVEKLKSAGFEVNVAPAPDNPLMGFIFASQPEA